MGVLSLFEDSIKYKTMAVTYKNKRFGVEVADTFRKVARGLMGHKPLGKSEGMLFVFDSDARHGFWMLNMRFSVDIIWLDGERRVVHIWKDARPCTSIFNCPTENPNVDSRYVLEFKAGTSSKLELKIGDRFYF